MACPACGCKTTYQFDSDDDCGAADDRLERIETKREVQDILLDAMKRKGVR